MHAIMWATIPMASNMRPTVKARMSHCRPVEITSVIRFFTGQCWMIDTV